MITVTVSKKNNSYISFTSKGHAGYAEEGYDIICAAVSALVINTVNSLDQLTKDQTYVQYEMDLGHLTWEQAQTHPQRNVLLQCVGASDEIHPDYFVGDANPATTFILCSDGFRHVISPDEICEKFRPELLENEDIMLQNIVSLVELNKSRKEVDNISAAVIRTCREG